MTYTYCEAAMWHIMMPAAFRYLSETNSDWDIPVLKRRSKQIYRQIVPHPRHRFHDKKSPACLHDWRDAVAVGI